MRADFVGFVLPIFCQVKNEVGFQKDMLSLLGAMDGVVSASAGEIRRHGGDVPEFESAGFPAMLEAESTTER